MRSFLIQLIDEVASNVMLHRFLWSQNRPPWRSAPDSLHERLASGELSQFYAPAPAALDLQRDPRVLRRAGEATTDGDACPAVFDLTFASPVHTPFPENNRVWLRHWRHTRDARWAVLGLDGLVQLGPFWFHGLARMLQPHGIDVVMMDEPYNFRRTPRGYQPGQLVLGGDVWHQLAVLRQGVLDAWCVLRSLRQAGYRVGVVGVSFGGLLALLLSLVATELSFVIALAPPADPLALLREGGQVVRAMRRGLGGTRVDQGAYRQIMRTVRPILWQPRISAQRIHLHAARFDRIVPPARIQRLAQRWNTPFTMHDHAHWGLFFTNRFLRIVVQDVVRLSLSPGSKP